MGGMTSRGRGVVSLNGPTSAPTSVNSINNGQLQQGHTNGQSEEPVVANGYGPQVAPAAFGGRGRAGRGRPVTTSFKIGGLANRQSSSSPSPVTNGNMSSGSSSPATVANNTASGVSHGNQSVMFDMPGFSQTAPSFVVPNISRAQTLETRSESNLHCYNYVQCFDYLLPG